MRLSVDWKNYPVSGQMIREFTLSDWRNQADESWLWGYLAKYEKRNVKWVWRRKWRWGIRQGSKSAQWLWNPNAFPREHDAVKVELSPRLNAFMWLTDTLLLLNKPPDCRNENPPATCHYWHGIVLNFKPSADSAQVEDTLATFLLGDPRWIYTPVIQFIPRDLLSFPQLFCIDVFKIAASKQTFSSACASHVLWNISHAELLNSCYYCVKDVCNANASMCNGRHSLAY